MVVLSVYNDMIENALKYLANKHGIWYIVHNGIPYKHEASNPSPSHFNRLEVLVSMITCMIPQCSKIMQCINMASQ